MRALLVEGCSIIGKTLGHYRILEKIGQGGMGEVFLAEDTSLHRNVALKFLSPEMQQDATAHKRSIREARSAAALDHPFICHINEVAESDGRDFIVMEYVDGQSLKDRLVQGPLAYAGLAMGYIEIAHGADPTEDALQRAKAAARTALRLDDTLAETLVTWGFVEGYYDWQWDDALHDIQRALDINPSLAMGHYHLSWIRALFGRTEEAIREHRRAQELDPFNPMHTGWLGELYRWERRYDEAAAEARKAIQIDPTFPEGHFVLSRVYLDQKKYDQAIAETRSAASADPGWRWALGPAYVAAGRPEEARKVLAELNQQKVIPWTVYWRIMNYAALGENDDAFRWLNDVRQHCWIPWIRVNQDLPCGNLRKDPRFPDQMRRMNLPPVNPGIPQAAK